MLHLEEIVRDGNGASAEAQNGTGIALDKSTSSSRSYAVSQIVVGLCFSRRRYCASHDVLTAKNGNLAMVHTVLHSNSRQLEEDGF